MNREAGNILTDLPFRGHFQGIAGVATNKPGGPEFGSGSGTYVGNNKSIWALYELVPGQQFTLQKREVNTNQMFGPACDTRAAASAFAGPNGELALYCQQKQEHAYVRTEGAVCGVLGTAAGVIGALGSLLTGDVVGAIASFFGGLFGTGASTVAACSPLFQNGNGSVAYTEYWPSKPILDVKPLAETSGGAAGPTQAVAATGPTMLGFTVNVSSRTSGAYTGIMEVTSGQVCDTIGPLTTCTWHFPAGAQIGLVPLQTTSGPSATWSGECARDSNALPTGDAQPCVRTLNGALSSSLRGCS